MIDTKRERRFFWGKRPGFDAGDVLHVGVNLLFVGVLFFMAFIKIPIILTLLLIVLAKWRVLAVRTRFWWPNIKANLVDLVVGVATVDLLYQTNDTNIRLFWAVLYAVWLIFIKPRSSDLFIGMQAAFSQLIGMVALFAGITSTGNLGNSQAIFGLIYSTLKLVNLAALLDSLIIPVVVCASVWVMSWAAARHFFGNYEEPHYRTLSLAWSFITTQMTWMSLHWVQYHSIFSVRIAVAALFIAVLGVTVGSMYHASRQENFRRTHLTENAAIGGILLLVILLTSQWRS